MNSKLLSAIKLREEKNFTESERVFKELINKEPTNATYQYHYAWLSDTCEKEREAIPKYEKAIALGLKGNDLVGCYLGLGSTYRCIGEYQKSVDVFNIAIKEFPHNNEYKVFKSMALYNLGKHDEAMRILLTIVATTSSDKGIKKYKKAIKYYSDKLNTKFE